MKVVGFIYNAPLALSEYVCSHSRKYIYIFCEEKANIYAFGGYKDQQDQKSKFNFV